jgi:hypothetical protein
MGRTGGGCLMAFQKLSPSHGQDRRRLAHGVPEAIPLSWAGPAAAVSAGSIPTVLGFGLPTNDIT